MNKIVFEDKDLKGDKKRLVFSREVNKMTNIKGNEQNKLSRKR